MRLDGVRVIRRELSIASTTRAIAWFAAVRNTERSTGEAPVQDRPMHIRKKVAATFSRSREVSALVLTNVALSHVYATEGRIHVKVAPNDLSTR